MEFNTDYDINLETFNYYVYCKYRHKLKQDYNWTFLNDSVALQLRATGYKKYKLYSEIANKMFSDKSKNNDNRSANDIIDSTISDFCG